MVSYNDLPNYCLYKINSICNDYIPDYLDKDELIEIIETIEKYLNMMKDHLEKI